MRSTAGGHHPVRVQRRGCPGRRTELLEKKQLTVFAIVDHSGEAAKAGLAMPNTKLAIFGSPAAAPP
jgi:hypothetical protein